MAGLFMTNRENGITSGRSAGLPIAEANGERCIDMLVR